MDDLAPIVRAFQLGQYAAALAMIEPLARGDQENPTLLLLHGLVLAGSGRPAAAVTCFRRLAELLPENPEHWLNLGNALRESGQLEASITALETAVARGATGVDADLNLGLAFLQAYRLQEAVSRLRAAAGALPGELQPRMYLARAYSELGEREQALNVLAGIELDRVDDAEELNHLGVVLGQAGESVRAEQALRRAVLLDPGLHEPAHNLASMLERQNRLDEARQALDGLPGLATTAALALTRARIAIRDKDYALARMHFAEAERLPLDHRLRIDLHFDRGKVHDSEGNHEAAMQDFRAAHEASVALLHLQYPDLAADTRGADWGPGLAPLAVEEGTRAPLADGMPPDPVFVVGFPRSGTTLLEQLLNAHPGLQSMDEQLAVEAAIDEFRDAGHRYPEDLQALDGELLTRVRRRYWDEVARVITIDPGTRLVDKYPFNAVRLPFIARAFPAAKVVMLLRHPADACLSCYMQKFRLNVGTQYWASLETITELYARMMSTWLDHCAAIEGFPVHTLRYEDLVADMPARMQELLEFLGLPWDEAVLGYADKARHRGRISTPSYAQVTEPIYRKAVGRWQHYERHLAPYLPTLLPYIDRYGYAEDGDVPGAGRA